MRHPAAGCHAIRYGHSIESWLAKTHKAASSRFRGCTVSRSGLMVTASAQLTTSRSPETIRRSCSPLSTTLAPGLSGLRPHTAGFVLAAAPKTKRSTAPLIKTDRSQIHTKRGKPPKFLNADRALPAPQGF